jgi:hypothetical protein
MNEKIKQLVEKAPYTTISTEGRLFTQQDLAKFAELIVRECIEQIKLTMARDGHSTEHYKQSTKHIEKIKQHFGVEE